MWSGGVGRASTCKEDIELDKGVFSAGVARFEGVSAWTSAAAAFWAWT